MDSLITAAARALAAGDPLGALKRVALRDDAPALALRGIALAQLGDFVRARALVRRAARAFGPREVLARARCVVAEAEIALASRDLDWPARPLDRARLALERSGDRINAAHVRYLEARRMLLIGRLDEAERLTGSVDPSTLPSSLQTVHDLVRAGIAMRHLQAETARAALVQARLNARRADIPSLTAEVETAWSVLTKPAARLIEGSTHRVVQLGEVEALLASTTLVVDACRHAVRDQRVVVPLASRPVLFALARALGEAWPGDVSRRDLVACAFGARDADDSHRARLRVEMGRLRRALRTIADVSATKRGFALSPRRASDVVVMAQPVDDPHSSVLAFLLDGEAWSTSALALALGTSQRTVQRSLEALASAGKAQSFGRGRARRWTTPPVPGFTTTLLLPAPLPDDRP